MASRYTHLQDHEGNWVVREDVLVRFRNRQGIMAGGLSIGFTGYGSMDSRHHIGPELQIGHQLGDAFEAPVLLVKTAWGGKSLYKDFRPPSSGGATGHYYAKMLEEVDEALNSAGTEFPTLKNRKLEVSGFSGFRVGTICLMIQLVLSMNRISSILFWTFVRNGIDQTFLSLLENLGMGAKRLERI